MADFIGNGVEGKADGLNCNDTEQELNPFSFAKFMDKSLMSNVERNMNESYAERNINIENIPSQSEGKNYGNPYSFQNFDLSNTTRNISKKLQIIDDDVDEVNKPSRADGMHIFSNQNKESESDSEWDEISGSPQANSYDIESGKNSHLMEIEKLRDENESLRKDLLKVKEEFLEYRRTANKRVTSLQKELEKVRKKEVEETQALENAVRMVEENLKMTTRRAVKAESAASRLKEEIKFMKEENVPKSEYDKLMREHTQLLNNVKGKSKHVAQLMRDGADKTEPIIRQLQSGIASLNFYAQQLDDIGKITELPTFNENSGDKIT